MACCHHYVLTETGDGCFSVDASAITFGPGALREAGENARALGMRRVALFTDPVLAELEHVAVVAGSLRKAGMDVAIYDEVKVEPTDQSFLAAARFASEGKFDGFVSVGGGSVMDTCKAANLYCTYPADFLAYVNLPLGEQRAVPGPLKPHIACPTTCGTGSECTGIAVFDYPALKVKTGIVSKKLRPTLALIDPTTTYTLPAGVAAASGFDVLSHALESFTARPYTRRPRPAAPQVRPMSQGANPWSDVGAQEALRLAGQYLGRAVVDSSDHEARDNMMFAATLAGIAFGNAGVHLPHGMSYAVAGLVREFHCPDYPQDEPLVPHGVSVIVNAPSAFRYTASACPARHLEAARLLGAEVGGAAPEDAGEILARQLIRLMKVTGVPNGIAAVGYTARDVEALAEGAYSQQRLVGNSPRPVGKGELAEIFRGAMAYW